ncbi:hypothetical protein FRC17_004900 [Serendipita sp. 399]|nr:hypothetical protein FRC17_004900 [Serendipita sp. 399]
MSMSTAITYDAFQTHNGGTLDRGGPWNFTRSSTDIKCSLTSYDVTFVANISIPTARYGNVASLDYEFSYGVIWASSKAAAGLPLTSRLTVGDDTFSNDFGSDDTNHFHATKQGGTDFVQQGTTSLITYAADPSTGYIPITIGLTFPFIRTSYTEYYMRNATFKITTPIFESTPSASTSSPASTCQLAQSTAVSEEGGQEETDQGATASPSSVESTLRPSESLTSITSYSIDPAGIAFPVVIPTVIKRSTPTTTIPTCAITSVMVGFTILLVLLVSLFALRHRRRERMLELEGEEGWIDENVAKVEEDRLSQF